MGDLQNNTQIPPFFICPISLEIMKDPVTLSTGITYDRLSIENWLRTQKTTTCPVTKLPLTDLDLTPNHTLRRLIQSWCTLNASSGFERFPTPRLPVAKRQILKLLQDLKHPDSRMKSLKRLRTVVLEAEMNKRSMETVGAADYLTGIVSNCMTTSSSPESDIALSILYHMHLSQAGLKSLLGKTGDFVGTLTHVMQRAAEYESRAYAVMLLKSMFEAAEPMQTPPLDPQFFVALVKILTDRISEKATKSTLKLLINVCPWGRNRIKEAEAGVVPAMIDTLLEVSDRRVSEMALMVLDQVCRCAEGRAELMKHGAGLAVVSKKIFRVSPVASERAVRVLYSVAKFSGNATVVQEMLQLRIVGKLCLVLQVNCGRKTKEKAMEILKLHSRSWRNSSCMPNNLISSYPL